MKENGRQTGGERKTWLFDPNTVEEITVIENALIHYDEYFFEEYGTTTLGIVMDKILEDLPVKLREAVTLVHLRSMSYREAGRMLDIDHKTVKTRVEKGIEIMRARLVDSVWVAEMLRGYLPADVIQEQKLSASKVADILKELGGNGEQE